MRLSCLLIFLVAIDVSVGLSQEKTSQLVEPKTTKKPKEIYPLVLGNTWVYETISYNEEGSKKKPKEDICKVKGLYDLPEGRFFCLEEFDWSFWSRNTPKGLEDTDIEIDEETMRVKASRKPSLTYKYPVIAGEKYLVEAVDEEKPHTRIEVRSIDIEVQTSAGKFKCIEYAFVLIETGNTDLRTFLAPGIGPVKYMTYVDGKLESTSVLKSYKLLKAK